MQKFIDHVLEHCDPKQLTYTRVEAARLIQDTGVDRADLDAQWPEIELALQKNNLIMLPALPDADEGEAVRVFRCDAPLTRVLLEVLYPTDKGDTLLVETIRAITQPARPNRPQQQRPRHDRRQRHDHRPRPDQSSGKGRPSSPSASAPEPADTPNPMDLGSKTHFTRPLQVGSPPSPGGSTRKSVSFVDSQRVSMGPTRKLTRKEMGKSRKVNDKGGCGICRDSV